MKNVILLAFIATMMSCSLNDVLDCYDGAFIKKELELNAFHKFDIDFPCEIILEKGTEQKITIEGREDMIRDIESRSSVSNDTWEARIRNNCIPYKSDAKIIMTVPDLASIKLDGNARLETATELDNTSLNLTCDVDGNANIFLNILTLNTLQIKIDGNAKAELKGSTSSFDLDVDGNATIHGHDLPTENCNIIIDGNAKVNVRVTKKLMVNIDGSATVCYKGEPDITSKIDGIGRIENCN